MLYRLYIHDEQVLMPTVAETEEGFYVDIKPVQKFKVTDLEQWKPILYKAIEAGNSIIPTPEQHEEGGSALLESLNLQKWAVFEKKAVMYTIHTGMAYTRVYRTGKGTDGMWAPGATTERTFDRRTPLQYVVDAVAEDAIKQPEAFPFKTGGLMVLQKTETASKSDETPKSEAEPNRDSEPKRAPLGLPGPKGDGKNGKTPKNGKPSK